MRQLEPKRVTIGEVEYAIYPFGAFDAAAISGDLAKILGPFVAGLLPLVGADGETRLNGDLTEAMPAVTSAFQSLDGDKLQGILRQLLIVKKNISCEYRDENDHVVQQILTIEVANQIFVGKLDEMIQLAVEVIKFNYAGFFTNLLDLYGGLTEDTPAKRGRKRTASSKQAGFVTLS